MFTGLLLVVAGFISPALAQAAGWLVYPFLAWTTGVVEAAARLPFTAVDSADVPYLLVVGYYIVLIAVVVYCSQPRGRRPAIRQWLPRARPLAPLVPVALAATVVWAGAFAQPDAALHVSFLDVGQGDATLIKTPGGQVVLVDGGPSPTRLEDALGRALPFYRRDIALLVLTRVSDDKLTGLVSLLERYQVGQVIEPDVVRRTSSLTHWRELLAAQHVPTQSAVAGTRVELGDGVRLEIESAGDDDEGLAVRLRYGAYSLYFDHDGAQHNAPDESAWVVRVGGHGGSSSVSAEWLAALAPQFAVISVGAGSKSYPAAEVLASLTDAGVMVYRTDEHSTITFSSDGDKWWIETAR